MSGAHYFASDVHLRPDAPERDRRFLAFVRQLTADDSLTLVGDICDFWMGSRLSTRDLNRCPSLAALAEFRRAGGDLAVMAGNHDLWLLDYYERELGATILHEPYDLEVEGIKLRLVHGHLLGARRAWKAFLESRAFFRLFGWTPGFLARPLDRILAWKNLRGLLADEERHLKVYRDYARSLAGDRDLVLVGHVHRPVDEPFPVPRLVVLGGWQRGTSYLRIDAAGATFHVVPQPTSPPLEPA